MADGRAVCGVCPHACALSEGRRGLCRARVAYGGRVVDENYGRVTSIALDPVEKKPLARFRPGSTVLSLGSYGCNLRCPFCQNADIACAGAEDAAWRYVAPEEAVGLALRARDRGCVGVAYTYNEPLVGYEYVRDVGRLASEAGSAVKRTIEMLAADPTCHLEVTTLVIPGLNDDPDEIDAAAAWLASLDPAIPYHLTRFFPCHRMLDRPPTPVSALHALADVARRHLSDVLLGNC